MSGLFKVRWVESELLPSHLVGNALQPAGVAHTRMNDGGTVIAHSSIIITCIRLVCACLETRNTGFQSCVRRNRKFWRPLSMNHAEHGLTKREYRGRALPSRVWVTWLCWNLHEASTATKSCNCTCDTHQTFFLWLSPLAPDWLVNCQYLQWVWLQNEVAWASHDYPRLENHPWLSKSMNGFKTNDTRIS